MARTDVSSSVLSIVASFASGLDVFRRLREARRKREGGKRRSGGNRLARKEGSRVSSSSGANASPHDDELSLGRSLRQGPEDIGREYARSVGVVGEGFGRGDAIAQTSLAEILLRLNAGLVTIISTFLDGSGQKGDGHLDYAELTRLSESSRIDTCRTLRGLMKRMMAGMVPRGMSGREEVQSYQAVIEHQSSEVGKKKQRSAPSSQKHNRARGPMLAKVVIADSTKPSQAALVRPGERKKRTRSSTNSNVSKVQSNVSLAAPVPTPSLREGLMGELPSRPIQQQQQQQQQQPPRRNQSAVDVSRMQPLQPSRKQSAMDMSSSDLRPRTKALRTTQSTPRLDEAIHEVESLPPMPNTAPLPAFEPRRRKPTPTYYSIETTGTKLGEIPLHKWAEPYDFDAMSRLNREAVQNGWPLNDLNQTQVKKKRGLAIFRMFRKKEGEV